jgi:hypothetical protein
VKTYKIKVTRSLYGPATKVEWLCNEAGYRQIFDSVAAAKREIEDLESREYRLKQNEHCRPAYSVVAIK